MSIRYYLSPDDSDISRGYDWDVDAVQTAPSQSGLTVSVPSKTTEYTAMFSESGVPGTASWPVGNWSCNVNVSAAGSPMTLDVHLCRVNSSGTRQISLIGSNEGATTVEVGNLSFTWTSADFGSAADTDRIEVCFEWYNNHNTQPRDATVQTLLTYSDSAFATVVSATGAATLGSVEVAGTAKRGSACTGAVTLGNVVVAGSVTVETPQPGQEVTGAVTLGSVTVSGAAKRGINCTGAATLAGMTVAGASTRGINCTGAITLGAVAVAGASKRAIPCEGAATLPSVTASGSATRVVSCTGAIALPAVQAAGLVVKCTPLAPYKLYYLRMRSKDADGVISSYSVTGANYFGTGAVVGAVTLPVVAVSGAVTVAPPEGEVSATGAVTLGAVAVAGASHRGINCTGAAVLGGVTVSGASKRTILCQGAVTLGAVTVAGAATNAKVCSGAVTLPTVTVAGQAVRVVTASGAITLGAITVAGEANKGEAAPNTCTGAVTLGSVAVAGAAHRTIWCEGAITLGAVEVSGGGAEDLFKNKTEQWLMWKWHRPVAPKVPKHIARMTPAKMYSSKWGEGTW